MKFTCRPVDLDFVDSAPLRFVSEVEIAASPEQVFNIFEDENAWPKWFDDIVKVEWTSPKPYGVGTTRIGTLKRMTVHEKFIAWDPGRRFAFCLTAATLPIAHAFCEDYRLKPLGNGKTRFTYTIACEPRWLLKLAGPLGRRMMDTMLRKAAHSLAAFMQAEAPR